MYLNLVTKVLAFFVFWVNPDTKEYIGVMDLFTKEFLAINNGNYELETTCKLIE